MMRLMQSWDVAWLVHCRDTFRAEIENHQYLRRFIDEPESVEARLTGMRLHLVEQELQRRGHEE